MAYLVRNGRRSALPLMNDFDRMMDRVFGAAPRWDVHYPAVDVREDDDRYVLEAELPGLTEEDVSVRVEDSLLVIESAKESEESNDKSDDDGNYTVRERRRRSFRRAFSLPKDVDRGSIDAVYENGLLVLTLGKVPEAQPRQIEIKRA